jgi:hypothetical protein
MGKIIPLPTGVHVSVREFCDETGTDRETVAGRIKSANVAPSVNRGRWPLYRLRDLLRAAYTTTEDGAIDPDRLRPFERKAHYQAEHEKLRLQTERGELVSSIEVEQQLGALFKEISRTFETLPDILERDAGATPEMLARVERTLDEVRERLYQDIAGRDDADGAAEASA